MPTSGPRSNQKCTQDHNIFLYPCSKWLVWGHLIEKLYLKHLCHFHLPCLYPDALSQPSMTLGAPLRSQKHSKMHPRSPHFLLSMPKVASYWPSHSKIASKTSGSFPASSLYPDTLSQPSVTPMFPRALKQPEMLPRSPHFSFFIASKMYFW